MGQRYATSVVHFDISIQAETNVGYYSGPTVTNVDKTNAPPFDGSNTQCFLSQFINAIYVINGDASNPYAIHIFSGSSKTWTVQNVQGADGFDVTNMKAILDHDTNVFCESGSEILILLSGDGQGSRVGR